MRKRYIPAFLVESIATIAVAYNIIEMLTSEWGILEMRPAIWLLWIFTTILTAPAFILWLLERRGRETISGR